VFPESQTSRACADFINTHCLVPSFWTSVMTDTGQKLGHKPQIQIDLSCDGRAFGKFLCRSQVLQGYANEVFWTAVAALFRVQALVLSTVRLFLSARL
jgi:hypothetical protein